MGPCIPVTHLAVLRAGLGVAILLLVDVGADILTIAIKNGTMGIFLAATAGGSALSVSGPFRHLAVGSLFRARNNVALHDLGEFWAWVATVVRRHDDLPGTPLVSPAATRVASAKVRPASNRAVDGARCGVAHPCGFSLWACSAAESCWNIKPTRSGLDARTFAGIAGLGAGAPRTPVMYFAVDGAREHVAFANLGQRWADRSCRFAFSGDSADAEVSTTATRFGAVGESTPVRNVTVDRAWAIVACYGLCGVGGTCFTTVKSRLDLAPGTGPLTNTTRGGAVAVGRPHSHYAVNGAGISLASLEVLKRRAGEVFAVLDELSGS